MTLTLELPAPLERRLTREAAVRGTTVEAVAVELLEKAAPPPTFDEAIAAFAAEFDASGMTEEELDALIDEARQEVWEEQQRKRAGS
jgi:hypothetical protein